MEGDLARRWKRETWKRAATSVSRGENRSQLSWEIVNWWGTMATAWNREPRAVREEETLAHALQVVEAMAGTLNSHRFFRLYEAAPGMNGFLMDFMVFRARRESFARMKAAFSPSIDAAFIRKEWGVASQRVCNDLLRELGGEFTDDGSAVETGPSGLRRRKG